MELINVEISVTESGYSQHEEPVVQLQELQLALVGGGIGDTVR